MDALIKAECNKFVEKVENDFYDKARKLQRDIIKATSNKYGFDASKAMKDYGLEEDLEEESYGSLEKEEEKVVKEKVVKEKVVKEKVVKEKVVKEKVVKEKVVKEKDPNAPKRPTTSYAYFMKAKRQEVAKEFPTEVKKRLGERWKAIKDTPEADPYKDLNSKDKVRYEEEMRLYVGN
jgi:hypothetical protein